MPQRIEGACLGKLALTTRPREVRITPVHHLQRKFEDIQFILG